MKKIIFTIAAFLLLTASASATGITVQELHARLAAGDNVLLVQIYDDVERDDFNLGGKRIHTKAILDLVEELKDHMDDEIILYNRTPKMSLIFEIELGRNGFSDIHHLTGGLLAWIEVYGRTMPKPNSTPVVGDPPSKPASGGSATPKPTPTPSAPAPKGYVPEMTELLAKLNGPLPPSQRNEWFTDLSTQFEKLGDAQKTEWLPYYYSALAISHLGWLTTTYDKDLNANKGNAILNKAEALSKGNSEIYIVRAMFARQQLMVDPASRWQSFGQQAGQALETAKKLNPNNPRVYLKEGEGIFSTLEQFGGGSAKAKPILEEAVRKFDTFRPESSLSPNWGRDALAALVSTYR